MNSKRYIFASALLCVVYVACCHGSPMAGVETRSALGGVGQVEQATPAINDLVQTQTNSIKKVLGREFDRIEAISYARQLVNGVNYFIKCKITDQTGKSSFVHLKIYKAIKNEPTLISIAEGHSMDSDLEYFE